MKEYNKYILSVLAILIIAVYGEFIGAIDSEHAIFLMMFSVVFFGFAHLIDIFEVALNKKSERESK